jgi:hypothetical protein
MRPLFLQIPLTDAIKMPPYSKYMKDIVTNKRKIPSEEISTVVANYSFDGKVPEKLGDPGIPTIPCSIKNNYVRTTFYVIWEPELVSCLFLCISDLI